MQDMLSKLKEWQVSAEGFSLSMWDNLPEIELYMDQVITYTEKQLQFFQQVEEVKLITPSMINNYVKDDVIKHAVHKKYNKEHLASLIMVGLLKQVLPISKIKILLNEDADMQKLYDTFLHEQSKALKTAVDKVGDITENLTGIDEKDRQKLFLLAMSLSAEAFANRIASEKLLNILMAQNNTAGVDPLQDMDKSGNTPQSADVIKNEGKQEKTDKKADKKADKKEKPAKDKAKTAKAKAKAKQKPLKDKSKGKTKQKAEVKNKEKRA